MIYTAASSYTCRPQLSNKVVCRSSSLSMELRPLGMPHHGCARGLLTFLTVRHAPPLHTSPGVPAKVSIQALPIPRCGVSCEFVDVTSWKRYSDILQYSKHQLHGRVSLLVSYSTNICVSYLELFHLESTMNKRISYSEPVCGCDARADLYQQQYVVAAASVVVSSYIGEYAFNEHQVCSRLATHALSAIQ